MRTFPQPTHYFPVPIRTRRRLPHAYEIGTPVFVTWRLHGSLPEGRFFPGGNIDGRSFLILDALLDQARSGPRHLARADIATAVVDAIRYREDKMQCCSIHAYVVMPNHVHVLLTPKIDLPKIMHSLKRHTARFANQLMGVTGPFWQAESYDHLVRTPEEFKKIKQYMEWNPVSAGLVASPEKFPYVWCEQER
jgi:putative transposase